MKEEKEIEDNENLLKDNQKSDLNQKNNHLKDSLKDSQMETLEEEDIIDNDNKEIDLF